MRLAAIAIAIFVAMAFITRRDTHSCCSMGAMRERAHGSSEIDGLCHHSFSEGSETNAMPLYNMIKMHHSHRFPCMHA